MKIKNFSDFVNEEVQDIMGIKTKYNIKPSFGGKEIPEVQDTMSYPTNQSKEMEEDELNRTIYKLSPYYKYVKQYITKDVSPIAYERDEQLGSGFSFMRNENKYGIFYNETTNKISFQAEEDGDIFAIPIASPFEIKKMM
jgi:hypothetical protein